MPDISSSGGFYPPVSFHFKVEFPLISSGGAETGFQSVSGLSVEMETETFKEGGENRFEHRLPVRSKYPNLVLKRGMMTDSNVVKWCQDVFLNMIVQPTNVVVKLLNERGEPLRTWNVVNAYPLKWNVSDFKSDDNSVVIETLELSYQYFTVI